MSGMTKATLVQKVIWTKSLMTIELDQTPDSFQAGQFFNLGLEIEGQTIRRAYSAASAPGAPLQFYLSRVEEGVLSPRLFELSEGDSLSFESSPHGFFVLDEIPSARSLWMVATGTGLGPYISMLRSADTWRRFETIVLVHGARHVSELAYGDELRSLCCTRKGFRYIPVVSGEETTVKADSGLLPLRGRITKVWTNEEIFQAAGRSFDSDSHMLLCGNPSMIQDMSDQLKLKGFEKHRRRKTGHFSFEKYW